MAKTVILTCDTVEELEQKDGWCRQDFKVPSQQTNKKLKVSGLSSKAVVADVASVAKIQLTNKNTLLDWESVKVFFLVKCIIVCRKCRSVACTNNFLFQKLAFVLGRCTKGYLCGKPCRPTRRTWPWSWSNFIEPYFKPL